MNLLAHVLRSGQHGFDFLLLGANSVLQLLLLIQSECLILLDGAQLLRVSSKDLLHFVQILRGFLYFALRGRCEVTLRRLELVGQNCDSALELRDGFVALNHSCGEVFDLLVEVLHELGVLL